MGKNIGRHCHNRGVERWHSFAVEAKEARLDLCDECIVEVGVPPGDRLDNCTCELIAGPNAKYCFECRDTAYQRHNMAFKTFQMLMNETCPSTIGGRRTIRFDVRRQNWIRDDWSNRDWPTRCPCGNLVKTKGSGWGACPRCFNLKVGIAGMIGVHPALHPLVFPKGMEDAVRDNRVRDVANIRHKFEPMKDFFRLPVPAVWPGRQPFPFGQFYQGILPGGGTQVARLNFGNPQPPQQPPASKAERLWGDMLNWGP